MTTDQTHTHERPGGWWAIRANIARLHAVPFPILADTACYRVILGSDTSLGAALAQQGAQADCVPLEHADHTEAKGAHDDH